MENKKFAKTSLIYLIVMCLIAVIFFIASIGVKMPDWLYSCLIQIVVMFGGTFLLYTMLVSKKPKQTFKDFGFKRVGRDVIALTFVLGLLLFLLNSVVSSVANGIIYYLGYESISIMPKLSTPDPTFGTLLYSIAFTAVLPAFCEEFVHRGMLFGANQKLVGSRQALLISSLLFGLLHFSVEKFFYATILGYLIGYVAYVTESIYPSMIIHFVNNFVSVVLSYLEIKYDIAFDIVNFLQNSIGVQSATLTILFISLCLALLIGSIIMCYKLLYKLTYKRKLVTYAKLIKEKNLPIEPPRVMAEKITELEYTRIAEFNSKTQYSATAEKYKIFYRIAVLFGSIITLFTFIWGIL